MRRLTASPAAIVLATAVLLAAAPRKRAAPNPRASRYEADLKAGRETQAVRRLLAGMKPRTATSALEATAAALARKPDRAERVVRALTAEGSPAGATAAAELLWRIALKRKLSDPLASLAAGLLGDDDPFVRGLAEWAIAARVGQDNGGQVIRWPRKDPPAWFVRWRALAADALLEADYVRQGAVWGIHHDGRSLLASAGKIVRRGEDAAAEVRRAGSRDRREAVEARLAEVRALRGRLAERLKAAPDDVVAHRKLWVRLRRAARPIALANPAVDFDELVFVCRHAAHSHRNITGSQYPWVHKPGGDICVKRGLGPGGAVRGVLAGKLGPGHVHGLDLWWDADRVAFGYAKQPHWPPKWDTVRGNDVFRLRGEQEPTHVWEVGLDGSGLRQLTDHPYWSDFEPTYCADGGVVFASDRSGRSSECGRFSADHTVINLYALSADGRRIHRLSDNKDIDRYPHSLDNGLIAYTRWEYQERHFFEVHAVWTVRPDGRYADAVFNQHLRAPFGLRDTRSIPNSRKLVSIACGHHTFAYGPVVVLDPAKGINEAGAIQVVTPRVRPQEGPMGGRPVPGGGPPDRGGLYQTPWALSERCFLVSYSYARPPSDTGGGRNAGNFALYLIDVHGNKELIHRECLLSCAFPIPLRRRPRPPVLADVGRPDAGRAEAATCYVADVYNDMPGVRRGTIRHLRISQRVGWPLDDKIGAMRWIPGNAWSRQYGFWAWAPVRVIGTVRVEADGSAKFKVPADTAVYFQALDEKHMEIRRMRSHVTFQAGETRGCLGCHETKLRTPRARRPVTQAVRKKPQTPAPPPWGATRLLGYEWLVQPIFTRHCVRCHGGAEPKGGLDLTAARAEGGFCRSFRSLFPDAGGRRKGRPKGRLPLVSCSDRLSNAAITQPKQFGSHKSRLVRMLLDDASHRKEVKLSRAEWIALVTWVDASAPYYDTFCNRRPSSGGGAVRNVLLRWPAPFAACDRP